KSEDKSEDKSKEKEDDKKEESKKESEDKDNDKEKDESEQSDEQEESDEEEDKTSENEEEELEEYESDYSFTIQSGIVEGEMDVLGALSGEIDIEQVTIQGLNITQNVETADGREVVIQIKPSAPVEVYNLQTKNI